VRANRKFVNYPCFIKERWAYKQTYHSMTEDNVVAKILRRKAKMMTLRRLLGILRICMRYAAHGYML
jgi:hypothetical protein